jgi:hypothetical protein
MSFSHSFSSSLLFFHCPEYGRSRLHLNCDIVLLMNNCSPIPSHPIFLYNANILPRNYPEEGCSTFIRNACKFTATSHHILNPVTFNNNPYKCHKQHTIINTNSVCCIYVTWPIYSKPATLPNPDHIRHTSILTLLS